MRNCLSTSNDINNSRPFDIHVWSDYPEFNQLVDQLWFRHFPIEDDIVRRGPKSKATSKDHFKALLLDLYVSWLTDPNMYLGISMSKSGWNANSRYNALHLSFRIVTIIKNLAGLGIVEFQKGRQGTLSRIRAAERLQFLFRDLKLPISEIVFDYMKDPIILRDTSEEPDEMEVKTASKKLKKPNLEYNDTPETKRMRGVLNKYNELLNKSRLDVFSLEEPYFERSENRGGKKDKVVRHYITGRNHFVRRIFNNGSWELGGRFYGGWWQQIGKELRLDIMINDNPIVEVDFTAMHIALLQAKVGKKPDPDLVVSKDNETLQGFDFYQRFKASRLSNSNNEINDADDPYTLNKLILPHKNNFNQRKVVKQLVLMAINAVSRKSGFSAFRSSQATGDPLKKMTNAELSQLLDAFIEKHPELKSFLCTGKGLELMYLDSRIAESVIEQLTDKSILVLCVHDSFIVANIQKHELLRAMEHACKQIIGRSIKSDYKKQSIGDWEAETRRRGKAPEWRMKRIVRCSGYMKRMGLHPYDDYAEFF